MISPEFGIIEDINETEEYLYEPEKYNCVCIDDDVYIDDWWKDLILMKTYFHNLNRPNLGLARWGITLIAPESLATFQNIVLQDKRITKDKHLVTLANEINEAMSRNKYMCNGQPLL